MDAYHKLSRMNTYYSGSVYDALFCWRSKKKNKSKKKSCHTRSINDKHDYWLWLQPKSPFAEDPPALFSERDVKCQIGSCGLVGNVVIVKECRCCDCIESCQRNDPLVKVRPRQS